MHPLCGSKNSSMIGLCLILRFMPNWFLRIGVSETPFFFKFLQGIIVQRVPIRRSHAPQESLGRSWDPSPQMTAFHALLTLIMIWRHKYPVSHVEVLPFQLQTLKLVNVWGRIEFFWSHQVWSDSTEYVLIGIAYLVGMIAANSVITTVLSLFIIPAKYKVWPFILLFLKWIGMSMSLF